MDRKNYTEVLIDGKVYTLGGAEEELYLQKVASYLNEKIGKLRKQKGFGRMSADDQFVMGALNLADDYFKEQERADLLAAQKAAMEKDTYSLKHELITNQMKLESIAKELEDEKKKCRELEKAVEAEKSTAAEREKLEQEAKTRYQDLKREADAMKTELQKLKALQSAAAAASQNRR